MGLINRMSSGQISELTNGKKRFLLVGGSTNKEGLVKIIAMLTRNNNDLNLEPFLLKRYADIEKHGLLNAVIVPEEFSLMQIAMRTWQKVQKREVFSAEETIRRARSRLGEKSTNLLKNNCEHFAIWCKTGLSKSYQVEAIIQGIPRVGKELA